MEFLLLPSLLLLLLHAGAIRICEHQEDGIFRNSGVSIRLQYFEVFSRPPPLAVSHKPRNIPKPNSVRNAEPPFSVKRPSVPVHEAAALIIPPPLGGGIIRIDVSSNANGVELLAAMRTRHGELRALEPELFTP